jgi:hypothetical protein
MSVPRLDLSRRAGNLCSLPSAPIPLTTEKPHSRRKQKRINFQLAQTKKNHNSRRSLGFEQLAHHRATELMRIFRDFDYFCGPAPNAQ